MPATKRMARPSGQPPVLLAALLLAWILPQHILEGRLGAFAGAESSLSTCSSSDDDACQNEGNDDGSIEDEGGCNVYLSKSFGYDASLMRMMTTKRRKKKKRNWYLGLFAGKNFAKGEYILPPSTRGPELALAYPGANINEWSPWQDIFFDGRFTDSLLGEGLYQHDYYHHWFLPGIASLASCELDSSRVNIVHAPPPSDEGNETSSSSVGSFSPHRGFTYVATRPIVKGEEFVVSCDFDMSNTDWGEELLLGKDSDSKADELQLPDQVKFHLDLQERSVCMDNLSVKKSTLADAGLGAFARQKVGVGQAIATTPVLAIDRSQVDVVEQKITDERCRGITESSPYQPESPKSDGALTLEEAATIAARELELCPPVALTRNHNITYKNTQTPEDRNTKQLLLNYCLGHPKSNVLLLPLGMGVNFVNHAIANGSGDAKKFGPNAMLRWTGAGGLGNPSNLHDLLPTEMLDLSYADITANGEALMVEVVALREINPGEEILISYGEEWDREWAAHEAEGPPSVNLGHGAESTFITEHACYFASLEHLEIGSPLQWDDEVHRRRCLRPCDIVDTVRDEEGEIVSYDARVYPRGEFETDYECTGIPFKEDGGQLVRGLPPNAVVTNPSVTNPDQFSPSAFRHEVGVPANFYPPIWMTADLKGEGDFLPSPLLPGQLEVIRWADNGKVVTPHAYRAGLPSSVRETLLEYCEKMGIIEVFRHVTVEGNGLEPDSNLYMYVDGKEGGRNVKTRTKESQQRWYLQRPNKSWRSNLHWYSPSDAASQRSYLEALGAAGFDTVLDSIGKHLGMDGVLAYHITFIAASHSIKGYTHFDVQGTGAKIYNVIIPLLLAEETGPELDLGSYECRDAFGNLRQNGLSEEGEGLYFCIGRYRYENDVACLMGDDAYHATSAVDYRMSKEMRLAATVYIADMNEDNVDSAIEHYTQSYPPADRDMLLSWAGEHWIAPDGGGRHLPRPKRGKHVLAPE